MLFSLWHPAVVRRHNEKRQINRADARDHVFYEIFVAGHIHDAEMEDGRWEMGDGRGCRQFEVREAEVNRDAALFFLRQPIGINARQRLNQRAFAVVHMPGGGEDEVLSSHVIELKKAARTI